MSRWVPFGAAAAFVILLDRLTKLWVLNEIAAKGPVRVTSFFNIVYVTNTGGAFGVGRGGNGAVFIVASVLAIVVVLLLVKRLKEPRWYLCASLGAVAGGGLGNLYDRLVYGSVVDFLDFHIGNAHWPAFNVADSAVVVGVVLFALLHRRGRDGASVSD